MKSTLKSMVCLVALLAMIPLANAAVYGPTATEIKEMLHSPAALLLIAFLTWLAHGKKQTFTAARQGTASMGLFEYFSYWKETLGALAILLIGFGALIATDQITDEAPLGLLFTAAVGLGIAPNSFVDLVSKKGRSAELAGTAPPEGK